MTPRPPEILPPMRSGPAPPWFSIITGALALAAWLPSLLAGCGTSGGGDAGTSEASVTALPDGGCLRASDCHSGAHCDCGYLNVDFATGTCESAGNCVTTLAACTDNVLCEADGACPLGGTCGLGYCAGACPTLDGSVDVARGDAAEDAATVTGFDAGPDAPPEGSADGGAPD